MQEGWTLLIYGGVKGIRGSCPGKVAGSFSADCKDLVIRCCVGIWGGGGWM